MPFERRYYLIDTYLRVVDWGDKGTPTHKVNDTENVGVRTSPQATNAMNMIKRLAVVFTILLGCVGCDQGTKSLASLYLPKNEMHSYFLDTLRIGYVENTGAFLGLGSSLPQDVRFWIFTVLAGAFLIGLFAYAAFNSKQDSMSVIGLSLVLSGGASNLYDRIVNDGAVIDFLNLGVGAVRTGIFNVADVAIMLGIAVLLFTHFKDKTSTLST